MPRSDAPKSSPSRAAPPAAEAARRSVEAPLVDAPAVDAADRRIVDLLRADGRLSVNELAQRANVSRANAYQRLDRLRRTGVIRGFSARTDPRLLGLAITAVILVNVEQHAWRRLRAELLALPGAEYLALTTGGFDFLLLVRVPDVTTLRDVVLEGLQTMPGVTSTQTVFVLDEDDRRL
jgi:DNA-binding Lrp family transcriptional regulator